MKTILTLLLLIFLTNYAFADLKYQPIKIELKAEKQVFQEGETITLKISIRNTDPSRSYPFLVPKMSNGKGAKLFYVDVYDRAKNSNILRYSEDRAKSSAINNAAYEIRYIKPLESIEIPFNLNETDSNSIFNHQIGVPLFAGIYQFRINYQSLGISEASNVFHYYNHSEEEIPNDGKMAMPSSGLLSDFIQIKIKRTYDSTIVIAGKKYYIKPHGDRYIYLTENLAQIVTDERCVHITNIPPDSCSIHKEYFYSYFENIYAEYINRFDDGDIIEYRKFRNECPEYLHTEKFNENKERTLWAYQLPDKSFYKISYIQPGNLTEQEIYCPFTGNQCKVITFIYDKNGMLKTKKITYSDECVEVELDGKKHYYKAGVEELGGR